MTKEEAIKVIEQALNVATLKGTFTLTDIEIILKALQSLKSIATSYDESVKY